MWENAGMVFARAWLQKRAVKLLGAAGKKEESACRSDIVEVGSRGNQFLPEAYKRVFA